MDEKTMKELMSRYKELSYSRRATLQAVLEVIQGGHIPPDEKIERIEMLVKSAGISVWREDNQPA